MIIPKIYKNKEFIKLLKQPLIPVEIKARAEDDTKYAKLHRELSEYQYKQDKSTFEYLCNYYLGRG